jgi:hypothetical protein
VVVANVVAVMDAVAVEAVVVENKREEVMLEKAYA